MPRRNRARLPTGYREHCPRPRGGEEAEGRGVGMPESGTGYLSRVERPLRSLLPNSDSHHGPVSGDRPGDNGSGLLSGLKQHTTGVSRARLFPDIAALPRPRGAGRSAKRGRVGVPESGIRVSQPMGGPRSSTAGCPRRTGIPGGRGKKAVITVFACVGGASRRSAPAR